MTGFTPLYDRILVQPTQADDMAGTLFIPEMAKEKPLQGEVLALGQGRLAPDGTLTQLTVKQGDIVLFSKFAGDEIKLNGEIYLVMREADVFGVLET